MRLVFLIIYLSFSLICPAKCFSGHIESSQSLILENNHIIIELHKKGGYLLSFRDKLSGFDLTRDAKKKYPLYEITCKDRKGKNIRFNSNDANTMEYEVINDKNKKELVLHFRRHLRRNIDIDVKIFLLPGSSLSHWTATIKNHSMLIVTELQLPYIILPKKLGGSSKDDVLVLPYYDGAVLNDLERTGIQRTVTRTFPGSVSVQFMAFHDSDIGIYAATYDNFGNPKSFGYKLGDSTLKLIVKNLFTESRVRDFSLEYDILFGFFGPSGKNKKITWHNAADVYKRWAIKQPWCKRKLIERNDIPKWFKKGPVFLAYPLFREDKSSIPQTTSLLRMYGEYLKHTIIASPRGWEKHGTWIGPDIFPTHAAKEFGTFVGELKESGNKLILYLEGYQWILESPKQKYTGWEYFRKHCRDCAVTNREGKIALKKQSGTLIATGCRTTEAAQKTLFDNAMKCVSAGADVIQIEQVGGGGEPCYNPTHQHPPGYGKWLYTKFATLIDRVKTKGRKINPELVVTIEEPCELYINHFDGYNGRDYKELAWPRWLPRSLGIPLFTYIYHEYALGFSGYHWGYLQNGSNRYQYRDVATNFIYGKMNGYLLFDKKKDMSFLHHNNDAKYFMKNVAEAFSGFSHDYLVYGEMLKPSQVNCGTIEFQYPNRRTKIEPKKTNRFTEPRVLHSAWKSPDGNIGYIFANYTGRDETFSVVLDSYGLITGKCKITMHNVNGKSVLYEGVELPRKLNFELKSLNIMLVEVKQL